MTTTEPTPDAVKVIAEQLRHLQADWVVVDLGPGLAAATLEPARAMRREVGAAGEPADLRALLPESPRRAYDVHPVVHGLLDDAVFEELQAGWAPNVVVGFGRLCGRSVGVIANNPLRKGGCLDSLSAEKASRFVRMCDAFGVPLVVLVDVPGYLPGVGQEWDGVVRRGAKLLHAFSESVVPRVTLVTRKTYGGAYIAMNARSLGATKVFAWPGAEVAVMGAVAAIRILHRRKLAEVSPEIRPQVEGIITRIFVRSGDRVAPGGQVQRRHVPHAELVALADQRDRTAQARRVEHHAADRGPQAA